MVAYRSALSLATQSRPVGNCGTHCFFYIREFAVEAPCPGQTPRADSPGFAGVEFMVCTITSLITFAVFGVLAVGFANLPKLATRLRPTR